MKKLLIQWSLGLFSIRFLVVGLALLLLAGFFPLNTLDQYWFKLSNQLLHTSATQTTASSTAVVGLDDSESGNLHASPALALTTFKLLQQQMKRGGKAIVLLRQPPLITTAQLQALWSEKKLQGRIQSLKSWAKSKKLHIGVAARESTIAYQNTVALTDSQQQAVAPASEDADNSKNYLTPYYFWLNRQPPSINPEKLLQPFKLWPFAGSNGYAYPLLWRSNDVYYQDLTLRALQQVAAPSVQWVPNTGLITKDDTLFSGTDATVFPLIDTDEASAGQPPFYSLSQAMSRTTPKQLLIIGSKEDEQLFPFAQSINAVFQQNYLQSPPWLNAISWISLFIITVFLVCLLPMFTVIQSVVLTGILTITLLAAQISMQLIYGYWIPIAAPLILLLAGCGLMIIHNRQFQRFKKINQRYQQRSLQLASTLYHQGKLEEASQAIADIDTSPEQLTLYYDIARQHEQTQQLDTALMTYHHIQHRQKNFKDVGDRINQLDTRFGDSPPTLQLAATQTMVLPEQSGTIPHLGRYEIIREIGRGAMGIVYLGKDPRIARTVAIKTLPYDQLEGSDVKEMKQRFFREAEAAGRLNHPNIVTIFDMGEEHSMAFIAMDFAKGSPLNKFCKPQSLLPVATVYKIMADVADALSYAHQQHIVHRDIKPGNIVFDPDSNEVKVTDFGIARISDDSRTKTGSVMGSPLYMSPEQLKGAKVKGTADIYSLGVTFYQLLTGAVPFDGDTLANLTYQIINSKYKSVRSHRPELPASAARIINKALQKEASKRYQDAAEMAEALRKSMHKDFPRELA